MEPLDLGQVPTQELNKVLGERMMMMCFEQLRPTQRRFGSAVDHEILNCFKKFMQATGIVVNI